MKNPFRYQKVTSTDHYIPDHMISDPQDLKDSDQAQLIQRTHFPKEKDPSGQIRPKSVFFQTNSPVKNQPVNSTKQNETLTPIISLRQTQLKKQNPQENQSKNTRLCILFIVVALISMGLFVYQISSIVDEIKVEQRDILMKRLLQEKSKDNQSDKDKKIDQNSKQKPQKTLQKSQTITQKTQTTPQKSTISVQWPQQKQLYHIYSALNPRLVLDVAQADDGYHDLILYGWKNQLNQMYYFKQSKEKQGFYHIVNAESGEYMKKSEKVILPTNVTKIKFSKGQGKLWQLIPAKANAGNSFYIVSEDGMALDLNQGYAQEFAQIIQYDYHKMTNQVWFVRRNISEFAKQETNLEKYEERASKLMYNVMSNPDSVNQCITFYQMKLQMTSKNLSLPQWMLKPQLPSIDPYELPPQVKYRQDPKQSAKQQLLSQDDDDDQTSNHLQNQPLAFKPTMLALECAKNHTITYVWYGNKTIPKEYQQLLDKCKGNVKLLGQKDFDDYSKQWNEFSQLKIQPEIIPIRQKVNLLKLLYLYFESRIYADFDTQINEHCFQQIYTSEVIFTSRIDQKKDIPLIFPIDEIIVPEESFMMVRQKNSPQVKRMIEEELKEHDNGGGDRWRECKYRQCLIVYCQRHYRDNTYRKGYD